MKNIFIVILLGQFGILNFGITASNASICLTISDCQRVIREAQKAIANNATDPHYCSLTQKSFTPDHSNHRLGKNAFKDQSIPAIIWGDIVMKVDGTPIQATEAEAQRYCNDLYATLPTLSQYESLVSQLRRTKGSATNFDSCQVIEGTETEFLPHLSTRVLMNSAQTAYAGEVALFNGLGVRKTFTSQAKTEYRGGILSEVRRPFRCIVIE